MQSAHENANFGLNFYCGDEIMHNVFMFGTFKDQRPTGLKRRQWRWDYRPFKCHGWQFVDEAVM